MLLSNDLWSLLGLWRPSSVLRAGTSEAGCLPDASVGTRLHIRPLRVPDVNRIHVKRLWAGSNAARLSGWCERRVGLEATPTTSAGSTARSNTFSPTGDELHSVEARVGAVAAQTGTVL